ncbi:molybdenum cofactor guanylyltransferase [Gephyromycinifex aptenodytis]|uniref:molybdenum cofactor guanylyltransferase n=1 Tax=Gephyromycinifex aptenodytis TaxID=2716227 RepID=UPI001445E431|nr:NTP transferase domain-containing protein [Gephyromycinifex aptenodytis]
MSYAVTAIVLCGGTSARMGGVDKTARPLGSHTIIENLIAGLPKRWPVVCVGESREVGREVIWTREHPPLGGPVAGIAAGLEHVDTPLVVILAGDQPFAADAAITVAEHLRDAPMDVDGVAANQSDGRGQPLLAAYRVKRLRAVMPDDPSGHGVHRVMTPLNLTSIEVAPDSTLDVDTPADLHQANELR